MKSTAHEMRSTIESGSSSHDARKRSRVPPQEELAREHDRDRVFDELEQPEARRPERGERLEREERRCDEDEQAAERLRLRALGQRLHLVRRVASGITPAAAAIASSPRPRAAGRPRRATRAQRGLLEHAWHRVRRARWRGLRRAPQRASARARGNRRRERRRGRDEREQSDPAYRGAVVLSYRHSLQRNSTAAALLAARRILPACQSSGPLTTNPSVLRRSTDRARRGPRPRPVRRHTHTALAMPTQFVKDYRGQIDLVVDKAARSAKARDRARSPRRAARRPAADSPLAFVSAGEGGRRLHGGHAA